MYITGERNGPPVKVGVAITDMVRWTLWAFMWYRPHPSTMLVHPPQVTGLYAHGAILADLVARQKTNRGQKVDISLIESQSAALANIAHNWLIGNQEASRWGTAHPSIVPYQRFPTKDSFIVVGAGNDRQFEKLCGVLGTSWAKDEKFKSNDVRVENRVQLVRAWECFVSKWEHTNTDAHFDIPSD